VATTRVREQHIAVFGGSGSGKTVLVSSFYGAAQEKAFIQDSLFYVNADDTSQGHRLHQNFLGMKNAATVPESTRFASTSYAFALKSKGPSGDKVSKSRPFDELRLVWHDYPGEWFEQDPDTATETARRVETFRALLRSDVAVVLVDGQKLLAHRGEEEKYLRLMFANLRGGLLRLKDELLEDGQPFAEFPRVWMIALSKADLLPDLDVHGFRELVIEKAGSDVSSLHEVVKGFVQLPDALSIGDDFMILSSAEFEPGKIEVTKQIGLDLVLPVATLLPLERLVRWTERFDIPRKLVGQLADNAEALAMVLVGANTLASVLKKVPKVGPVLGTLVVPLLSSAIRLSTTKIGEANVEARANRDHLTATLTQFRLDLDQGIENDILVKSVR